MIVKKVICVTGICLVLGADVMAQEKFRETPNPEVVQAEATTKFEANGRKLEFLPNLKAEQVKSKDSIESKTVFSKTSKPVPTASKSTGIGAGLPVARDQETGRVVYITGFVIAEIDLSITTPETVAGISGMQLALKQGNRAFYKAKNDVFASTEGLKSIPGVLKAEVEVLDHLNYPN
ncbi:MAG: hypothetical protein JJT78_12905 [Leptospira sp.]|nr:hypothetical protein [Leptospira sp.]